MEKIFKEKLPRVASKLQQVFVKISSDIKCAVSNVNFEDETTESKKTFYLLSLMLLISLIFLSPDKLAQALSPTQADAETFEKIQEIARLIKKIVPNFR